MFERAKNFFTTGNLVVRVGVVVLFFGVAFLLNYAYENSLLPVEFRLAGAALGGLALSIVGWHFRHRSDTYGLILQGAGVGLLYLTIFASARLYELLPMTGALGLLLALVAGSSVLAILQKSQAQDYPLTLQVQMLDPVKPTLRSAMATLWAPPSRTPWTMQIPPLRSKSLLAAQAQMLRAQSPSTPGWQ